MRIGVVLLLSVFACGGESEQTTAEPSVEPSVGAEEEAPVLTRATLSEPAQSVERIDELTCTVSVDPNVEPPRVYESFADFARRVLYRRTEKTEEEWQRELCPECDPTGVAIVEAGSNILIMRHADGTVSVLAHLGVPEAGRCDSVAEIEVRREGIVTVTADWADWELDEDCETEINDEGEEEEQCMSSCWITGHNLVRYDIGTHLRRVVRVSRELTVEPREWNGIEEEPLQIEIEDGSMHVTGCGLDETVVLPPR